MFTRYHQAKHMIINTITTLLNISQHLQQVFTTEARAQKTQMDTARMGECFIVEDGVEACHCPDPYGGKRCEKYLRYH